MRADVGQKQGLTRGDIGRFLVKSPLFVILMVLSIAAAYVHIGRYAKVVEVASLKSQDTLFRVRHAFYKHFLKLSLAPKDIILVAIDDESYKHFEKRWPWGRDLYAEFLDKLNKYSPRVIALDFALYGETADNPEADRKLAEAIKRCGNVIIASVYGKEKLYLGPHSIFAQSSAGHGVIGAIGSDPDTVIRRFATFVTILAPQKGGDISFEVKTAAHYFGISCDQIDPMEKDFVLKSPRKHLLGIPRDENGYTLINYTSDVDDIVTFSIWKVMEGRVPRRLFEDKLILVSQTGEIFHDYRMTPFGYRPGGVIIANVLNSILTSSYIRRAGDEITVAIVAILYLVCAFIFYKFSPLKSFIFLIFVLSVVFLGSFLLFLNGLLWPLFDTVTLLYLLFLGMTVYKYTVMVLDSAEVKRMAITDALTLLYTHRYFRLLLDHKVKLAVNYGYPCTLIVLKITNLDKIIKEVSFSKGQEIQKKVAELVRVKLTKSGIAAFLGMGEYGILLSRVGLYEALGIAGSLRNNFKETDFDIEEKDHIPIVAIGVSTVEKSGFPKTGAELIRSARAAMARAKEIGPNKVCRFNPKIDSTVFEPNATEMEIRQRMDDEFSFIAADLEERNRELEDLLRQLSITQRELEQAHFETLRSLVVALEEKDPCTAGHSERVGDYSEKIGRRLKMPEEELRLLKQAGVLHDIGKIGIPQDILRKEDKLSEAERTVIQLHPEFSVRILNTSKYFRRILHAIRDHHERLDGTGYPRQLKGDEISIEAQIISVVDVFDALSTDRPYRKAYSPKQAVEALMSQPQKYNQRITLLLKKILEEEHKL